MYLRGNLIGTDDDDNDDERRTTHFKSFQSIDTTNEPYHIHSYKTQRNFNVPQNHTLSKPKRHPQTRRP